MEFLFDQAKRRFTLSVTILLIGFIGLRIVAWSLNQIVEDHDSVGYMREAQVFYDLNWSGMWHLSADTNPVLPAVGALLSRLSGVDIENGLRLCSFLSSVGVFFLMIGIGRRLKAPELAILIGLGIFAFSPYFVRFSYSALSEPLYIAVCGCGLWMLLGCLGRVCWRDSVALGALFGIAFLTRTEGLLYLVLIPALFVGFGYISKSSFKERASLLFLRFRWSLVYVAVFLAVIAPQIWRVSDSLGQLGFNGRQVWTLLLKSDDGKGYEEKIYGLDHSETSINLKYVSSHPEAQARYASETNLLSYVKIVLQNYEELLYVRLPYLLTPLGIALLVCGVGAAILSRQRKAALVVLVFMAATLVGPLIHNVVMRHIAIIGPWSFLLQGWGAVYLASQSAALSWRRASVATIGALGLVYVSQIALPLKDAVLRHPTMNTEYDLHSIQRCAEALRQDSDGRRVRIASRKLYLAAFTNNDWVPTPFASFEQLARYCVGNQVDYLFVEPHLLKGYPFLEYLGAENAFDLFELVHAEPSPHGNDLLLYRIKKG